MAFDWSNVDPHMREADRQTLIATHLDITPNEREIEWDITADKLFTSVSESPHWWAYEAALIELQRDVDAARRIEQAKRAQRTVLRLVKR